MDITIRNKRLSEDEFERQRKEVLSLWPTGREVNLEEAVDFHKNLPASKNCARKLADAKKKGITMIRTSSGTTTIEGHTALLQTLQDKGGADVLETHVDSLTRNLRFAEAQRGLEESIRVGRPLLNGFPIVAHGVAGFRKVIDAVQRPVMARAHTTDNRLVGEMGLAAGATALILGPIGTFMQYSNKLPLEMSLRYGQYAARLIGYYEEKGVPILLDCVGGLAINIPHSICHAMSILEALMAAEQGVKNITFLNIGQGHLAQDIAGMMSLYQLGKEYLDRFGYKDMTLTMHQSSYGGRYPNDDAQAYGVICFGAVPAVLGGVSLLRIVSYTEAKTIPTPEEHAASVRAVKQVINMLTCQRQMISNLEDGKLGVNTPAVRTELDMVRKETRAIVDKVIDLGDGDVAVGAVRAVPLGILDIPFPTTQYAANRLLPARDSEGAVRYLDHGNLPFTDEIVEFHRRKLAERAKAQGRKADYDMVIEDVFSISQGYLVRC